MWRRRCTIDRGWDVADCTSPTSPFFPPASIHGAGGKNGIRRWKNLQLLGCVSLFDPPLKIGVGESIFIRSGAQQGMHYCWRMVFRAAEQHVTPFFYCFAPSGLSCGANMACVVPVLPFANRVLF